MRYYIFQLPISNHNTFRPLDDKASKIHLRDYVPVYTGTISSNDDLSNQQLCESLFARFNYQLPEHFAGHSLSISDVIALKDDEETKLRFYYCDAIGFKEVETD